ncbi:MAG: hypothetical protein ACYDC3_07130 [Candidatus Binataceae bacterium]
MHIVARPDYVIWWNCGLLTTSHAQAQDSTIFGTQQPAQDANVASPDKKKPPLTVTGAWSGTLDDNLAGPGTLDVNFTQAPNGQLSGSWSFAFSSGTDFGTVVGKASSSKVAIQFIFAKKPPYIHCKFSVADIHATDTDIAGNYHFTACGPHTRDERGTLSISPN